MTSPTQKSRWEKRAREYARASDTPATSHYAYLQGVSDCFAEMAAMEDCFRSALQKIAAKYDDYVGLEYKIAWDALARFTLEEDDQ
jgi:hypothetical protein